MDFQNNKNQNIKLRIIKSFSCFSEMTFKSVSLRISHNHFLEFMWTIAPSLILLFLAVPSLYFLNISDSLLEAEQFVITVHVIGNQWFWSYEYGTAFDFSKSNYAFDSYMIPEESLEPYQLRLLETDAVLILPRYTPIRFLITSVDVLHCWAIPSLGIKVDACPGRINQVLSLILRPGVFYGQCSEICGINHGFMPISIVSI